MSSEIYDLDLDLDLLKTGKVCKIGRIEGTPRLATRATTRRDNGIDEEQRTYYGSRMTNTA